MQWQLPVVDVSQALRGKRVSWFPVCSHDMDMGRRRREGATGTDVWPLAGVLSGEYTYDVWTPHWVRLGVSHVENTPS